LEEPADLLEVVASAIFEIFVGIEALATAVGCAGVDVFPTAAVATTGEVFETAGIAVCVETEADDF
jgi:hypothetical protein